ncbi:ABC transporter ATP-binding protein [Daejeonella oryzae]|uniref:ABC transporter ATP-binding protein n=1 Tax=Daejeonella oryzae TaxID=1122943 RepID=UPI000427AAE2|nr:ABC transporter ATP-binding protein [Daejeonella oryzae]
MSNPIISISNVSKHYQAGQSAGVSNINLSIKKGDFVAIVGESGCGKSTLLKLIYGLLSPTSGEILFKGEHLDGPHEKLIPGHDSMKMITQDFNLNLYARVYDNISGMLSNEDMQGKKQKTWEMMEFLGIDGLSEKRIVDLSGGEQQRVAIARAIITEPEVLLLDEPFSQVDAILKNQLRADLKRLCRYLGITMILVSHDPQDGLSLADQLILIKDGHIIQQGSPEYVAGNPASGYVGKILGNANIVSAMDASEFLHIQTNNHEKVLVYPHHIKITEEGGIPAHVKQSNFKLFYDELEVNCDGLTLRMLAPAGLLKSGQTTNLLIDKYTLLNS